LILGLAVASGLAGCQNTGGSRYTTTAPAMDPEFEKVYYMPTEPSITQVAVVYDTYSAWIWNEDRSRIRGIKVGPVYLGGPTGKGVFGDGTIRPRLYRLDRAADGNLKPTLLKEWSFNVEEARLWRMKRQTVWGWGYGLPLVWDDPSLIGPDVDQVRIVVSFERSDGRMVNSSNKDLRVPKGAH
jgi:hypothetical protein